MATVDASARVVDDADANACAYAKAACKEALGRGKGAETPLRVLEGATTKEGDAEAADTPAATFSLSDSSNTPAPEGGNRNDTDMEPNDFDENERRGSCWFGGGGANFLKPLSKEKRPALLTSRRNGGLEN